MDLASHDISDPILLELELRACGIDMHEDGSRSITIDDSSIRCVDLIECLSLANEEIRKLKNELFREWERLAHVANLIVKNPEYNESGCLGNLLFLNSVKKAWRLADIFDDLEEVVPLIKKILNCDISSIGENLVEQFNNVYTTIKTLHVLVMSKIYRNNVIKQLLCLKKTASIAGPWSNLDLPFFERVWNYDDKSEHQEYMTNRTLARQNQIRYNHENNSYGYYLVWPEMRTRNPYRYGDQESSPYPQRLYLSIP